MIYKTVYAAPEGFGKIVIESDGKYLTGLNFAEAEVCDRELSLPVFKETLRWLDIYFSGEEPDFTPEYKLEGISLFTREVLGILTAIPYGETVSYGDIAGKIAAGRGIARMSAQAVGGAVGRNPISIIIPCHRVVGANGDLTGYGGGLRSKAALLRLEGADMSRFFFPKDSDILPQSY